MNTKKTLLIVGILFTIGVLGMTISQLFTSNKKIISEAISLNNNEVAYLTVRSWGYIGNKSQVVFSGRMESVTSPADNNTDYVFEGASEVFYKKEQDTLFVFVPQPNSTVRVATPQKSNIKTTVSITSTDSEEKIKDYQENYEAKGWKKIALSDVNKEN